MAASALPLSSRALRWGAFATAYVACFCLSTVVRTPVFWYFPTQHRFEWAVKVEGLAADFYGRVALCLVVGAAAYVVAAIATRRVAPSSQTTWAFTFSVWALGILLFTAGLYGYLLRGRHATPAPLPPHYAPR